MGVNEMTGTNQKLHFAAIDYSRRRTRCFDNFPAAVEAAVEDPGLLLYAYLAGDVFRLPRAKWGILLRLLG